MVDVLMFNVILYIFKLTKYYQHQHHQLMIHISKKKMILYILYICYIIYIYILYICYIIYIYILYICYIIYIYCIYQQGFPYWGIGGNLPTSQKFAHSPRTWTNFFPHQRLIPSPLNKNFHVINQ